MDESVYMIVPAYNEGTVLGETLAELAQLPYSVVVVDDGSSDETWAIIQQSGVHGLRHPINLGQGAALQTGMTYALRHGAQIVAHFDADGQHSVADLAEAVRAIRQGEADIVLGSRFLRPEDVAKVPPTKRLVLRVGVIINGLLTGMWLSDAHNGFRVMSGEAAQQIDLRENRYAHATEILWQIRDSGLRYVEHPTTIHYTDYSKTKGQPISNAVNILIDAILRRILN